MPMLSTKAQGRIGDLKAAAEERLAEFVLLKENQKFSGAVLAALLAVELYLKCLICKRLGKDELPIIFHSHELEKLFYFTGLEEELRQDLERDESFTQITGQVEKFENLRYENPAKAAQGDCDNWEMWLNDAKRGLIPWFREKLR